MQYAKWDEQGSSEYRYVFRATMTIDTPKGKSKFFSQTLSAEKILPKSPLRAEMLMLFSEAGLIPVARMKTRPNSTGAKNVKFAYVSRSTEKPAFSSRSTICFRV